MSSPRPRLKPRFQVFFTGQRTNTQFLVQLSGYWWVARQFGPLSGRWVLDAASGTGFGSRVLASEGARVVGIDIDGQAVAMARRGNGHRSPTFLGMDAAALSFRDGTFDLVVSQDTLERVGSWLLWGRGLPSLEELCAEQIEYFEGAEGSGTLIAVCRKGES